MLIAKHSKNRTLGLGDVVTSPQFAYVTHQLERNIEGIYSIDTCKLSQLGFAAKPLVYRDNNGMPHEIIHSEYRPELMDHKFAVIAMDNDFNGSHQKYFLRDITTYKEYVMIISPDIHLKYMTESDNG